jgi:hypothetical protein
LPSSYEKRAVTTTSLGLPDTAPDEEIVEITSGKQYLLTAAKQARLCTVGSCPAHIAKSTNNLTVAAGSMV